MVGGTAPEVDDLTVAKRALRQLREILTRATPKDAELILGDGTLEALLGSMVPPQKKGSAVLDHLAKYKRRASLLARLRHGINESSVYKNEDRFLTPTKVQWFYDGLTFLEGEAPYEGVVGLYRDGLVRYGLGVEDREKEDSLGPLASDFVSLAEAKKSFRAAKGPADAALARLRKLSGKDGTDDLVLLLGDHPWMLGAQYTSIHRVAVKEPDLPEVMAKRASDGALDVLLVESPKTPIVGKSGRVLTSFREIWTRAEQYRGFVQRQATYLKRELNWKIREPRFLVIAGTGLSAEERNGVRSELERHHAAIRLITLDDLSKLAERTHAFFQSRL